MEFWVEKVIRRLSRTLKYQYLVIAGVIGTWKLNDSLNDPTLGSMRTHVNWSAISTHLDWFMWYWITRVGTNGSCLMIAFMTWWCKQSMINTCTTLKYHHYSSLEFNIKLVPSINAFRSKLIKSNAY